MIFPVEGHIPENPRQKYLFKKLYYIFQYLNDHGVDFAMRMRAEWHPSENPDQSSKGLILG